MRPLQDYDEHCLIPLVCKGNRDAFEEVYHRYHAALYQNILRFTKDHTVTEDLVQDTFIRFWQKRSSIRADKSLAGWLFVISYHLSVNWLKHKLVDAKAKQQLVLLSVESDSLSLYDHQMALLEQAILQLPPQKRRVLELCKLQGRSYKEAAQEMNISTHTVKEYLSGAMKVVRDYAVTHPEYKSLAPLLLVLFS
ncbi:MAG: sigma-70 family RNA polymerase sigma factor [Bacteroidetes bacterium]|nr:sigma-70 family RNA polymerase sigma factor [Bacteroidota bacterium]